MLASAILLSEHQPCGTLALVGSTRHMSAAIGQDVCRSVRQQHNIPGRQFPRRPRFEILNEVESGIGIAILSEASIKDLEDFALAIVPLQDRWALRQLHPPRNLEYIRVNYQRGKVF